MKRIIHHPLWRAGLVALVALAVSIPAVSFGQAGGHTTESAAKKKKKVLRGPRGFKGDKGDQGPKGAPGVSGYVVVSATSPNPAGSRTVQSADCPAGKKVLGGGALGPGGVDQSINSSFPGNTLSSWIAIMNNKSASDYDFRVYAICANVG